VKLAIAKVSDDAPSTATKADLAGSGIDHLDGMAGIIGLHDRPRLMAMTECRVRSTLIGAERLAKPSVAVTLGMGRAILLPQQR
jgi:hypothetical protein